MCLLKRSTFLLLVALLVSRSLYAQYKLEYGISGGPSGYLGEIGGKDKDARPSIADLRLKSSRPSFGIFVRKKYKKWLSVKLAAEYIRISGADSLSTIAGRAGRNLSFINDLKVITVQPNFYFFQTQDFARAGNARVDFRAFAFTGFSFIISDPKAKYQGATYKLRELKTEGQSKPYSKFTYGVPVGLGMDYTFDRKHRVGLEFCWNQTFSDYLDDISTVYADPSTLSSPIAVALANRRGEVNPVKESSVASRDQYYPGQIRGNPNLNDSFVLTSLSYSYVLKGKSSFYRSKYNYLTSAKRKFKRRRVRAKF